MERALSAEDPKFASSMRRRRSVGKPRLVIGIGVAAIGLVLLVLAFAAQTPALGVVAVVIMLAGGASMIVGRRRGGPAGIVQGNGAVRRSNRKRRLGLME